MGQEPQSPPIRNRSPRWVIGCLALAALGLLGALVGAAASAWFLLGKFTELGAGLDRGSPYKSKHYYMALVNVTLNSNSGDSTGS